MGRKQSIKPETAQTLIKLYNEIKTSLDKFTEQLVLLKQDCYLPQVQEFAKNDENELPKQIHISQTPTELVPLEAAIHKSFKKIIANPTENTRLAMRFPGYICIKPEHQEKLTELIDQINQLKQEFAATVRAVFNNRQTAHNTLHKLIPGLLYQQAIRPIYSLDTNCCIYFYWSIRPLVKRLTKEQAYAELDAAKEFRRFDLSHLHKDEMLERIEFEKTIVASVPADKYIIERRVARVQPFYDCFALNTNGKKSKKIACRNASLPLIIFGQVKLASSLKDYDEANMLVNNAPDTIAEELLIARKSWYITSTPKTHSRSFDTD